MGRVRSVVFAGLTQNHTSTAPHWGLMMPARPKLTSWRLTAAIILTY